MDHAFCVIARLNGFWAVRRDGRAIGAFAARADALRFAVQKAGVSTRNGVPLDILGEDGAGARYLLWRSERDSYSSA
jgi:hypothetical protein